MATAFTLVTILLPAGTAHAQLIWSSNYGLNQDLKQWDMVVDCGAPSSGYCPLTMTSPGCNTAQGGYSCSIAGNTPTPLNYWSGKSCPNGSSCRISLVSGAPDSTPGWFYKNDTFGGDRMWSGFRNELSWSAECNQQSYGADAGVCENLEGQHRYYSWSTYFDTFPVTPVPGPSWHSPFQFHGIDECDGSGPPLFLNIDRVPADPLHYYFNLQWKSVQYRDTQTIWQDSSPMTLGMHTFIMHVYWTKGNTGFVEFWIDGNQKTDARMSNIATLMTWPASSVCSADDKYYATTNPGGKAVSIYLKHGNYHADTVSAKEVLYHGDVKAGVTCADVTSNPPAGGGCNGLPPGGTGTGPDATVWTTQTGTPSDEYAYGVATDSAGGVYTAGYSRGNYGGPNAGGMDAIVAKLDASGTVVWKTQFGSTGDDRTYGLAVDGAGNVYVAGSTTAAFGGEAYRGGASDAFLVKLNGGGVVQWTRLIGTAGTDVAYAVTVDVNGDVYVAGSTSGSLFAANAGGLDLFAAKYSSAGAVVWTRQLGSAADDVAYGIAMHNTTGDLYLTGATGAAIVPGAVFHGGLTDAFLVSLSYSNGSTAFGLNIGTSGDDVGWAAATDTVNAVYIAGSTTGALAGTNAGGQDAFVAKYNNSAQNLWTRQLGSSGNEWAYGVAVNSGGDAFITGTTTGVLHTSNQGGYDAFVARYGAASGTQAWVRQYGSAQDEVARGVATFASDVYFGGGTLGSLAGTNAGGKDVFTAKYSQ